MFRILIYFLIFYLVYKVIKKIFPSDKKDSQKTNKQKVATGEKIVPCEYCKVYFPESQAILMDGKKFCSKECVSKYLGK